MASRLKFTVFDGCDRAVASALRCCAESLTPNHSITSRRYSVPTLLRKEADGEIERVLTSFSGPWNEPQLRDFKLSGVWAHPPASRDASPLSTGTNVDQALASANAWQERMVQAVRSAQRLDARRPGARTKARAAALELFCATLDTVISFVDNAGELLPARTFGPDGKVVGSPHARYNEFCELCWRRTQYRASFDGGKGAVPGLSKRYCANHNPRTSPAEYRRDLKFRQALAAEVEYLSREVPLLKRVLSFAEDAEAPSGIRLRLEPVSLAEEDVRRAAYALLRYRIRGTGNTRESVLVLRIQGMSGKEIAARLGLTERAVWYALSTARKNIKTAENIRWMSKSFPLGA